MEKEVYMIDVYRIVMAIVICLMHFELTLFPDDRILGGVFRCRVFLCA